MRSSLSAIILLLVQSKRLPCLREAAAQKEDIAMFESDVTLGSNVLDFLECDCVAGHTIGFKSCNRIMRESVYFG